MSTEPSRRHHRLSLTWSVTVWVLMSCGTEVNVGPKMNQPPLVSLLEPAPGSGYQEGESVTFRGLVEDDQTEPEMLYIAFTSDRDGLLAEGPLSDADGEIDFVTANLMPGRHAILLQAVDADGASGEDATDLTIEDVPDAPEIEIVHPITGETGVEGQEFTFQALVADSQDDPTTLLVAFSSEGYGVFCEPVPDAAGLASCDSTLAPGEHLLLYEVTDSDGLTDSASAYFLVMAAEDVDDDGDGWTEHQGDCDDTAASVNPAAAEYANGVDDDCDGATDEGTSDFDDDGDGFTDGGGDCDDADADIFPGATEACNGDDDDCDGIIDEGTPCVDDDGDAWTELDGDCDDADVRSYPGAEEILDGRDNDCDTLTDEGLDAWDDDGDCFCEVAPCTGGEEPSCPTLDGGDCDDDEAATSPLGVELCDGIDNDCDGDVDEDAATDAATWYQDADGDGFGDPSSTRTACFRPTGWASDPTDCDDADPSVNPRAWEACDGQDDDCDGTVDDGATTTWYQDADGDGFGDAATTTEACATPPGFASTADDCDDTRAEAWPGAVETCNGLDEDCNGLVDEAASDAPTWYADADRDGAGDATSSFEACTAPSGFVAGADDCNDANNTIFPGAPETCNGTDEDCDGAVDEGVTVTFYADADTDGYGNAAVTSEACTATTGWVLDTSDCDDRNSTVHPGAAESCNGTDDDCDTTVDEADAADAITWYADADADGWGALATSTRACTAPAGYVADMTDCDDANAAAHPGLDEACNGFDDDCDGTTDESAAVDAALWYQDGDGDGYGSTTSTRACTAPAGYTSNDDDCDDGDAAIKPSAAERCDGADNDCDGTVDETGALDSITWYRDTDGDGYGTSTSSLAACTAPTGYASVSTDCNDANSTVYPGAAEACNSVDDDCDGTVDDGVTTTWYQDADGDGYGDPASTRAGCTAATGWVANASDCDDTNAALSPETVWYLDADGDGFGNASRTMAQCTRPSGYLSDATDCNDASSAAWPGATERCDGMDNDCDGTTDESSAVDAVTWYRDADGDSYGTASSSTVACTVPSGYASYSTDCNDSSASIHPSAAESCNGTDDDCDGSVDEGVLTTWYRDADGDGYGSPSVTSAACTLPSGYVSNSSDCDDTDEDLNPATKWYLDYDGDGFGKSTVSLTQCTQPTGYVLTGTDCNDTAVTAYPGATESCDSIDNDCDGTVDEVNASGCTVRYYDYDGDGYYATGATSQCLCASSGYYRATTSGDCYDLNANAKPGTTTYYSTSRGDSSFDYDCNGVEDKRYPSRYACTATYWVYCDSVEDGWNPSTTVPSCGAKGTWKTGCEPGYTSPTCTYTDSAARTQTCR